MSKLVGEVVKKAKQVPAEMSTFHFKYKALINKIIFKYTFADFLQWPNKKIKQKQKLQYSRNNIIIYMDQK